MFERWTDVLAGLATVAVVAYVGWQIARRQKQLRDLMDMIGDEDRAMAEELEEMVRTGRLRPMDKLTLA
jgi:hypothetical protein